ncbi:MAG: hypothetical protein VR72_03220 [Clostridiaceae bacterium BRH_c20a]|nr:MAG: hypothetical protein VR72_03220 [Clostridiaceae bacterium BRH_c20a]
MKKLFTVFLVLVLLFLLTGMATAHENFIYDLESSDVFMYYVTSIGEYSDKIYCEAYHATAGYYQQSLELELQKEVNSSWEKVTSWYESGYTTGLTIEEFYPQSPGTYRCKSIHKAGGETKVSYSDTWTF